MVIFIAFPHGFYFFNSNCKIYILETFDKLHPTPYAEYKGPFIWRISDCGRIKFYTHSMCQYDYDIGWYKL